MFNIYFTFIFLGASAIYWGFQQQNLLTIRRSNQAAAAESQIVQSALTKQQQELEKLIHAEQGISEELKAAQTELNRVDLDSASPLDPAHEGFWPKEKPYFYMAKKHLPEIGWDPLDDSHRLHASAAAVLGLSENESNRVNGICEDFQRRVNSLQLLKSEPVLLPESANTESHREKSFRIAAATEEMPALRQAMADGLREVLGNKRGGLFFNRAASEYLKDAYGIDRDRASLVSLIADKAADGTVTHSFKRDDEGGTSTSRA